MRRRLFFTFANGLPGVGLLLLRMAVGIAIVARCMRPHGPQLPYTVALHLVAAGAGVLLLIGAWTSIAGVIAVISELWVALSHPHDPWIGVLLASLGTALALLGPGIWSVDARRRRWKRIEIRRPIPLDESDGLPPSNTKEPRPRLQRDH